MEAARRLQHGLSRASHRSWVLVSYGLSSCASLEFPASSGLCSTARGGNSLCASFWASCISTFGQSPTLAGDHPWLLGRHPPSAFSLTWWWVFRSSSVTPQKAYIDLVIRSTDRPRSRQAKMSAHRILACASFMVLLPLIMPLRDLGGQCRLSDHRSYRDWAISLLSTY